MKNSNIPTLPNHVRTFCEGELYRYLLNRAFVSSANKEIEFLLEEGGNKGFDKPYITGGEQIPEQQRILEKIEKITKGREAMVAELSCKKVEDIICILTPTELRVLERYYWQRELPEIIEQETGIGRKTQQRIKRRILYMLANRWGMA